MRESLIPELAAEIRRLKLVRGTLDAPPACDAQIALLTRRLRWHLLRRGHKAPGRHPNVGYVTLGSPGGRPRRRLVEDAPIRPAQV